MIAAEPSSFWKYFVREVAKIVGGVAALCLFVLFMRYQVAFLYSYLYVSDLSIGHQMNESVGNVITDQLIDASDAISLVRESKYIIKEQLPFPNTAEFPLLSWYVQRLGNYYIVASCVSFTNEFGSDRNESFVIIYEINDSRSSVVHFDFGNNEISNEPANKSPCILLQGIPPQ